MTLNADTQMLINVRELAQLPARVHALETAEDGIFLRLKTLETVSQPQRLKGALEELEEKVERNAKFQGDAILTNFQDADSRLKRAEKSIGQLTTELEAQKKAHSQLCETVAVNLSGLARRLEKLEARLGFLDGIEHELNAVRNETNRVRDAHGDRLQRLEKSSTKGDVVELDVDADGYLSFRQGDILWELKTLSGWVATTGAGKIHLLATHRQSLPDTKAREEAFKFYDKYRSNRDE